jgi:hypothetical protein
VLNHHKFLAAFVLLTAAVFLSLGTLNPLEAKTTMMTTDES